MIQILKTIITTLWFWFVLTLITTIYFPFIITALLRGEKTSLAFGPIWWKTVLKASGVKIQEHNKENYQKGKSYIFISNHASWTDIIIAFANFPQSFNYLSKEALFKVPIFGWSIKRCGYISIRREDAHNAANAFKQVIEKTKKGHSVLFYPEGSRSRDGVVTRFKKGAFLAAKYADVEILPIIVKGSNYLMPKGTGIYRPCKIDIYYQKPFKVTDLSSEELLRKMDIIRAEMNTILFKNNVKT
ncbi:lysophospholipid acyltransferase family protein [Candidatus Margulisiibacteriota bacterium]